MNDSSARKRYEKHLDELVHRFRQQQQFSEGYSPLYEALFGTVAAWLSSTPNDPIAHWLVEISAGRAEFGISNLLAAGLHFEVLEGSQRVADLAEYYPTVGGNASPDRLFAADSRKPSTGFIQALRSAILANQEALAAFIQCNSVQTNETGRGISWLLPASLTSWAGVHLVDLEASAGLNLIANDRSFQFIEARDGSLLRKLGQNDSEQFVISVHGKSSRLLAEVNQQPAVLSRSGCDEKPFSLKTSVDAQILASFIWADQVERMNRLLEAIKAFHEVQKSTVPVNLSLVSLPDGLPEFLIQQPQLHQEPLIIYNTFVKIYLPGKGENLRSIIGEWASFQNRPVIWIQWESPRYTEIEENSAPELGWLAWTADLWHNKQHHQFHFGWVHPHGRQIHWLPGLEAWISYWSRS